MEKSRFVCLIIQELQKVRMKGDLTDPIKVPYLGDGTDAQIGLSSMQFELVPWTDVKSKPVVT